MATATAALALLTGAPVAFAGAFSPESASGSPNAVSIDLLYKITFAIAIPVFLLVEGVLLYSLFRYRFRRGGRDPLQVRGNTRLELGWTAGASLIVVVLAVITFVFLPGIITPASGPGAEGVAVASTDQPPPPGGERPLTIDVNGQQYVWRFDYPGIRGRLFAYQEMVVPTDTTVVLNITSQDVAHSWWIPDLGGKMDALPGHNNETWFRTSRPGRYEGQCAELCGENHAQMRAWVRAIPPEQYRAWVARQTAEIRTAQEELIVTRRQRGSNE